MPSAIMFALHSSPVPGLQVAPASNSPACKRAWGKGRPTCRTQIASRTSELLAVEQQPITSLAWDEQRDYIWAGTTAATVQAWSTRAALPLPAHPPPPARGSLEEGRQPLSEGQQASRLALPYCWASRHPWCAS